MMDEKTFWKLSWSWGIIMTCVGKLVFMILEALGYKAQRNQYGYYIEIGEGWGGAGMGPYCICSKNPSRHTLNHEFGHAVQNCYFGPLQILISIASGVRYQYREYLVRKKGMKYSDLPPYDSAWYEGMATELGNQYWKELNNK